MNKRFLCWLDDWPGRSLLASLVLLLIAHVLAFSGFTLGLPPAPWGDEARHAERLLSATLSLVWQPWRALAPDAAWPAPLARLVVPLALLWLGGEGLAVVLRRHLRRLLVARRGGHAVLLGCCPVSLELVAAWLGDGRPVLVLTDDDAVRGVVLRAGAAHLSGHWGDERALLQGGVAGADIVACIAGSDSDNIDAAIGLARFVEARRERSLPPLQLLVHVADPFLRASIDAQIDRFAAQRAVELRFFSSQQIAARRLLRDFPIDFWQTPAAAEPRLWIFGLTPLAEELALAALRLGIYRHARPPAMLLVGADAERFRASLLARWPGAEAVGRLAFVAQPVDIGESGLDELLARLGEPTAIYFCHRDEPSNLAAALHLQRALTARERALPPFYLHAVLPGRHDLRAELGGHPWFHHFGGAAEVAAEILLGEKLDAMAVAIHEHYVSAALAGGEPLGARRSLQHWSLLPEDLKDDNRFVADHHFVKLRDSACALVGERRAAPPWDEAMVESLARVEHQRWMIQRWLAGWQHADVRDDGAKRHPDLVAWDELGESRRELDRQVVRQVPELFAAQGQALCAQQRILVRGPRTPWAFPEAFDEAVDGLLAEACTAPPDAVVLWIGVDSAFVWRLAERLLAAQRGRLGVVLNEPLQRVLDRLPSAPIRSRVLAVLRQAVGVIDLAQDASAAEVVGADSVIQISIDGSDLAGQRIDWGIDAGGRLLVRPPGGGGGLR